MNDELCRQLVTAVEITMNPIANQQDRMNAYKICEEFKEKSPNCSEYGFFFANKIHPPQIRHFGLQLIEHTIKFKWNDISLEEKTIIKNNSLQLLSSGTHQILTEQFFIKDSIAKITVEIAKREWPQQWLNMLDELNTVCAIGATQKELVLFVFLRLAEDVAIYHNVTPQRRRDLYQGLTNNLPHIWNFFLKTLEGHNRVYRQLGGLSEEALIHCRLVETTLMTIYGGYLEWIPLKHLTMNDSLVLKLLCGFLLDERLQLIAADCLWVLLDKKGKPEERKPLLFLFSEEAMSNIFQSAKDADNCGPRQEKKYNFLKKLCQVLASLSNQLTTIMGGVEDLKVPVTLESFLNAGLAFMQHSSYLLTSYIIPFWLSMFHNPKISSSHHVKGITPQLLSIIKNKLQRIGFPTRQDNVSCEYSRMDFDSNDEYLSFYNKYKVEVCDLIRVLSSSDPVLTFNFGREWIKQQIIQPIEKGDNMENGYCSIYSKSAIEWEALTFYLDSLQCKNVNLNEIVGANEGNVLLKCLVEYQTEDPTIFSCVLSCLSSLFEIFTVQEDILLCLLQKMFSAVVYSPGGQTKGKRDRLVNNVRRHSCSALIKLSKSQPRVFLPMFDQIYEHVKRLSLDLDQLSQLERCSLFEFLILINNEFNDYERQRSFLSEIVNPVQSLWLGDEFTRSLLSVDTFTSAIGLNQPLVEPSIDDHVGIFRSQILYCINFILGILKRSKWPDDTELALKGGFIFLKREDGTTSYRNPAMSCVAPFFNRLFQILCVLNSLWMPGIKEKFHPDFNGVLETLETERILHTGQLPSFEYKPKTSFDRTKNFISHIFEQCFHILGTSALSLQEEFYSLPKLSELILSNFSGLENVPDYYLRIATRSCFKNICLNCPSEYWESVSLPILNALCPFMFTKLAERWEAFRLRYGSRYEEEMTEAQEILDDQFNRSLSREYMDLLVAILLKKPSNNVNPDLMDDDMEDKGLSQTNLSPQGVRIACHEALCSSIVVTVFNAIHWLDCAVCVKASRLCKPLLTQLMNSGLLCNEQGAIYIMRSHLRSLQELGEHEDVLAQLMANAFYAYEVLRPVFPVMAELLAQIPGSSLTDIEAFDVRVLEGNPEKRIPEKKRKDMFRKLVLPIIGKPIAQLHKREIVIRNLKRLKLFKKEEENTEYLEWASTIM